MNDLRNTFSSFINVLHIYNSLWKIVIVTLWRKKYGVIRNSRVKFLYVKYYGFIDTGPLVVYTFTKLLEV